MSRKIIYIIDDLRIGGAQTHLLRLASTLIANGYPVEIICLDNEREVYEKDDVDIPVHHIKMDCTWKLYFWKNFITLIHLLITKKPTIIHTYLNTSNVFGVLAAKFAHIPIVISSRRDAGHFRSRLIGKLENITARLSNKVVCVSEAVRSEVIKKDGLPFDKFVVIYNGVDHNKFTEKNNNQHNGYFNISMVATMNRKAKGHSYFVESGEAIIKKRKDVQFTLIGDGALRESLESYVTSRGLSDYFNFTGKCNNLQNELENTDIIVVPSESEGCSNALLEAMVMGIVPIATAVEGNLEIIEDGISGFLIEPKSSLAIAEKILELLDSPEEMKRVSTQARKRIVESFTLNKMVYNYIELYETMIKEKVGKLKK